VNFDAFIVLSSSPSQGRLAENSSFKRSSFQGAEQWGHALECTPNPALPGTVSDLIEMRTILLSNHYG